ncbi:hypothetical protein COOONC_10750 [Cooperia oncophora]
MRTIDIVFVFLNIAWPTWVSCSEDEYRLIQDLRTNYDPIERPVRNHSEAIRVNLRILLQQLVDVLFDSNPYPVYLGTMQSISEINRRLAK